MTRIYAAINKVNLKMYIGQTINSLSRRFNSHMSVMRKGSIIPFHKALRKYGRNAFDVVELTSTEDRQYAHFLERLYIAFYHTYSDLGYNASAGGEAPAFGMKHTKQWCRQHSIDMSGERHPLFGTKFSTESKRKMSITRKGRLVKPEITNSSILQLYSSGLGCQSVAKALGVSKGMIRKRLKSQGIKSHPAEKRASDENGN